MKTSMLFMLFSIKKSRVKLIFNLQVANSDLPSIAADVAQINPANRTIPINFMIIN